MRIEVFSLRLVVAVLPGTIIGLERQWRHRMACTRTNALVSAGAAAFAMVGAMIASDSSAAGRIAGQIVSGVGSVGAGVIFKEGANIRGLNTAATVWCSAAVGTVAGMGYPANWVVIAAAVLLTNVTLRPLAYKLHPDPAPQDYRLDITCRGQEEARALLLSHRQEITKSIGGNR